MWLLFHGYLSWCWESYYFSYSICKTVFNLPWQSELCNSKMRRGFLLFNWVYLICFFFLFMVKLDKLFLSDWCQAVSSVHVIQCTCWCKRNHAADTSGQTDSMANKCSLIVTFHSCFDLTNIVTCTSANSYSSLEHL